MDFQEEPEAVYQALVLGTRDYIHKCGFERVLIGLSGGIDSSLTAAIAVEAVGKENVMGALRPDPSRQTTVCATRRIWRSVWASAAN